MGRGRSSAMASFEHAFACQGSPRKLGEKEQHTEDPRRDEWSVDAISSLLDLYEAKWNLRNRGNLKGRDWEDVAACVSSCCGAQRPSKSPLQCKNKVASMKQKFRSESLVKAVTGSSSRWQFFSRMDHMLHAMSSVREDHGGGMRGPTEGFLPTPEGVQLATTGLGFEESVPKVESGDSEQDAFRRAQCLYQSSFPRDKAESMGAVDQNRDSNHEDVSNTPPLRRAHESDTSSPRSRGAHMPGSSGKPSNKHRKHLSRDVADSISSFADSILRLEQTKMEMYKDSERIRAETEAHRADMELKRTEIIMNTQLEIAKLLSMNARKKKIGKASKGKPAMLSGTHDSTLQVSLDQISVEAIGNADMPQPM